MDMITSTVEIRLDLRTTAALLSLALGLGMNCSAFGGTTLGSWVPIFKGMDHALGTNTPGGGGYPDLQVVNAVRVDLTDPDIRLFPTPRYSNYVADGTGISGMETIGSTTTNFLKSYGVQLAVNANNFHDPGTSDSPGYTIAEGTPLRVTGALVCTNQLVSAQEGPIDDSTFLFTANNQATFVATNWPAVSMIGSQSVVSGLYAVLVNGVNIGSNYLASSDFVHQLQPRTAFGLSKDRRYLYILTIDGRQSGYSDGAWDWETAAWLQRVGAWDGANMDGGGSTCLVMQDSTGSPVELNRSSAIPASGRERTVGCHLGIFAKPLPGFINDVIPLSDDTAATITWTTTSPATSLVQYGLTSSLGSSSSYSADMVTNHAALLTGLTPGTGYYFRLFSNDGANQYSSANLFFTTANYATTNLIFDFTNTWTYATTNLDGVNWAVPGYNDSGWDGAGPGLLWVDNRGANSNPSNIPMLDTQMPLNPSTGYPFTTYYLRTHFAYTNHLQAASLLFGDAVDDGAIFYLNGAEIYRLRMVPAPTAVSNSTMAAGYPCSGDASCPDSFVISGDPVTNLISGDNVLAVEVHNYNAQSPDITFGASLAYTSPYLAPPQLAIQQSNTTLTVSWSRGGFTLQQANSPAGPWLDVPGPIVTSPFTTANSGAAQYFRLIK